MTAKFLNETCACRTFDSEILKAELAKDELLKGLFDEITKTRPNLFSSTTVFISQKEFSTIKAIVHAVESTFLSINFKAHLLHQERTFGPFGVFMGYDFHLSERGPKLIEVNTNAGGALLNLELAKAQQNCCKEKNLFFENAKDINLIENEFIQMFFNEWRAQKGDSPLSFIAIVDDNPKEQYLYPEFVLFKRLFTKYGIEAEIVAPHELSLKEKSLFFKEKKVDLVYNRLTDFYLEQKDHAQIKEAYLSEKIVLTPAPVHHALFANKKNLTFLSDRESLRKFLTPDETATILLDGIPKTLIVTRENSELLWKERKNYFFKPSSSFGSKAAYRGDKLTLRVWNEILQADYVAQELIPPSKRLIQGNDGSSDLKLDIRAYTYQGKIQLLAARLYSGQTTNFRTEGGGFAPVFVI